MREIRYVMEKKTSSKELNLISCGYEICEQNQSYGPCVRNYYMLHFVLKGQGYYYIGEHRYLVTADQCFLTSPGVLTLYKAEPENPWVYYWICFDGELVSSLLARCGLDVQSPVQNLRCTEKISQIITEMMTHGDLTPANESYIHSSLHLIFALLLENCSSTYKELEKNDDFYITKAIEYIRKNTFEDLTVNGVADYLHISRSYLFALFQKHLHTSPQQFLVSAKIANAQELLSKTQIPVSSVALSSGYKNTFAFSRAFKQETGMTPREYRQKHS